jgi:hypothetical protein
MGAQSAYPRRARTFPHAHAAATTPPTAQPAAFCGIAGASTLSHPQHECVAYLNDACTKLLDCADSLDGNGVCSAVQRGPIDERAPVVCAPDASIAFVSCGWACLACRRRRGFRSDRPNMRSSCRHFQLRSRRAQGSATVSGRRSGGLARANAHARRKPRPRFSAELPTLRRT